jgi:thiosulfate reductase cytochrome b subunit
LHEHCEVAELPGMTEASQHEVIYRHSGAVRVTHWVNVIALLVLLMSGLQIFNAHPALYLGAKSNFDDPVMAMRPMKHGEEIVGVTTIAGWNIDTTNLFGLAYMPDGDYEVRGFPWSVTLPGHRDLATGRRWHFFFAWLFVINGLAYLIYSLVSGHLRKDLAPSGSELKHIGAKQQGDSSIRKAVGDQDCLSKEGNADASRPVCVLRRGVPEAVFGAVCRGKQRL